MPLSFLRSKYAWHADEYDKEKGKENGFLYPTHECLPWLKENRLSSWVGFNLKVALI